MRWVSVDPAKGLAGVAVWDGDCPLSTKIVKKRGGKGLYYYGDDIVESLWETWNQPFKKSGAQALVMEKGAGGRPNIVDTQGWMRGYIEGIAGFYGVPCETVNVAVWRRCVSEAFKISWPRDRDRKKALSIKLVKEHYGLDVTDDEADAVLIGLAALRMRLVE